MRSLVVVCVVLALAGGCKKKGPGPGEDGFGADGSGLGESGVAGSSIDRARRGLGPEENGILTDVHFGYDSYEVDDVGRETIDRNIEWLRQNRRARVELEGHCDNRGTVEYNLALGGKRAKSVKDYLIAQGVAPERISSISYGEELPLCQDDSDTCWARNRRVHFVVMQ